MSATKTFHYQQDGLSYSVTIQDDGDGNFSADITLHEGSMDVNAIYFGSADYSGTSANLGGPLNMNGGGSRFEGEQVNWEHAVALSHPGLGHGGNPPGKGKGKGKDKDKDNDNGTGTNKATFLQEGETLNVSLPMLNSLDDIDFFGIRATSVNGGDSIKAVSGNPEGEEPDPGPEPDPETYGKVSFVYEFGPDGMPIDGFLILAELPEGWNAPELPAGVEPTFENFVSYFEEIGGDFDQIEAVVLADEDLVELFRLEGPFENADALLAAYNAAIAEMNDEDGDDDEDAPDGSSNESAPNDGDHGTGDTGQPDDAPQSGGERLFSYDEDGLAYNVRIFEEDGTVRAEVTVEQGSMDLNALYYTRDGFDGPSTNLGGPLNMNGGGSRFEGEKINWEDAVAISRPGLGREGQDKPSFLMEGDSFEVDLDAESVEDIDLVGIRATSVNGGNSIKGVSGNPETEDNGNGDNGETEDATYDKVFFVNDPDANDGGGSGTIYEWDELSDEDLEAAGLDPDADPTFANYVAVFEATTWFNLDELQEVRFFTEDENGNPLEIEEMRIEAPEGGFADADALLAAYDEAIAAMGPNMSTESLFISMDFDEMMPADDDEAEEDDTTFA